MFNQVLSDTFKDADIKNRGSVVDYEVAPDLFLRDSRGLETFEQVKKRQIINAKSLGGSLSVVPFVSAELTHNSGAINRIRHEAIVTNAYVNHLQKKNETDFKSKSNMLRFEALQLIKRQKRHASARAMIPNFNLKDGSRPRPRPRSLASDGADPNSPPTPPYISPTPGAPGSPGSRNHRRAEPLWNTRFPYKGPTSKRDKESEQAAEKELNRSEGAKPAPLFSRRSGLPDVNAGPEKIHPLQLQLQQQKQQSQSWEETQRQQRYQQQRPQHPTTPSPSPAESPRVKVLPPFGGGGRGESLESPILSRSDSRPRLDSFLEPSSPTPRLLTVGSPRVEPKARMPRQLSASEPRGPRPIGRESLDNILDRLSNYDIGDKKGAKGRGGDAGEKKGADRESDGVGGLKGSAASRGGRKKEKKVTILEADDDLDYDDDHDDDDADDEGDPVGAASGGVGVGKVRTKKKEKRRQMENEDF